MRASVVLKVFESQNFYGASHKQIESLICLFFFFLAVLGLIRYRDLLFSVEAGEPGWVYGCSPTDGAQPPLGSGHESLATDHSGSRLSDQPKSLERKSLPPL